MIVDGIGQGDGVHTLITGETDIIIDKETDSFIFCGLDGKVIRWPRRNDTRKKTIISNYYCSGLAMDNDSYLYISNNMKHEVRRWRVGDTIGEGELVAGGHGKGNNLNQVDGPSYIYVDRDHSVYISDVYNRRVMKWMKGATEGIIVADDQDRGDSLTPLISPRGVIIDEFGNVYVVDTANHRVMRWSKDGTQVCIVVGGNKDGSLENQLYNPEDLSFDRKGNLYVVDSWNHRVQRFDINSKSTEN